MTKREARRLEKAMIAYGTAESDCGEWNKSDSVESWEKVYGGAQKAEQRLRRLLGLPVGPPHDA
jgi:hypothetical protein